MTGHPAGTEGGPQPAWRGTAVVVPLALLALAFALYAPSLHAPWEYDDKVEIVGNRVLRSPGEVREMVAYNPFRVLLLYTFAWDIWAWGMRVEPMRLVNVAIHGGVVTLVWRIVRALLPAGRGGTQAASIAAACVLIHPLSIESVTYISGRSASLATFFVLLSLDRWLRFRAVERELSLGVEVFSGVARPVLRSLLAFASVAVPAVALGSAFGWSGGATAAVGAVGGAVLSLFVARPVPGQAQPPASLWRPLLASFVAFVAGALTKEIAAVLPALLFLVEWRDAGTFRSALRRLAGPLLPFFGIPALLVVLRVAAYGYFAAPTFIRPLTDQVFTQLEVLSAYARLAIWPQGLSIYHDWPVVPGPGSARAWLCAGLLLLATVAVVRGMGRGSVAALAVGCLGLTMVPESSIFPLKETMAEHRTYLPLCFGAIALAAALAPWLDRRPGPIWLALGLWGAMLLGVHLRQQQLWLSEEQLWGAALEARPGSPDIHRYLGDLYLAEGRHAEAEARFAQAVSLDPADATLLSKLGQMLARRGDLAGARVRWLQATASDRCHVPALNNLGQLERRAGAPQAAIQWFQQAVRCDAESWIAFRGLAEVYDRDLGDPGRAAAHYERALRFIDPYHPEAARLKRRLQDLTF